jgi:hypothetical protein
MPSRWIERVWLMWVATKSSALCFAPGTTAGSSFEGKLCMQWTALMYSFRSPLVREPHSFLTLVFADVQAGQVGEAVASIDSDKIPQRKIMLNEVVMAIEDYC